MIGFLKVIAADKGYGFIRSTNGKEYFFHRSGCTTPFDMLCNDFQNMRQVDVEFETEDSPKGLRATSVRRIL